MQTIKARLLPLKGKYYGTRVEIETLDGTEIMQIWVKGNRRPSARQLTQINMTEEEANEDGCFCDEHYETSISYWLANSIIDAINYDDFHGKNE